MTFHASGLITLTTDFGTKDAYVAAMKGVIRSIYPDVLMDDLTHEIDAQSILGGALFLADATQYYPKGTIHLAVVDPGVGSIRKPIAVLVNDQVFVCPDNGLLSMMFDEHPIESAREITNQNMMRQEISKTFHGRDIFAPVAAHLAKGTPFDEVGPEIQTIEMLQLPQPVSEGDLIQGQVIHIDHFGNCITNITEEILQANTPYRVQFAAITIARISENYAAASREEPIALFGSTGRLEIAIRDGNARRDYKISTGTAVTLYIP